MNKIIFFILVFLLKQSIVLSVEYYDKSIKSVYYKYLDDQIPFPSVSLSKVQNLTLNFDYIGTTNFKNLFIKITPFDWKWEKELFNKNNIITISNLTQINDFQISTNNYFPYTTYKFTFNKDVVTFLSTGNFLVEIIDLESQEIILKKKLFLYENLLEIFAEVTTTNNLNIRKTHQQINLEIKINNKLNISNPLNDLKVLIIQNSRFDNQVTLENPDFFDGTSIKYITSDSKTTFEGGKEYLNIDLTNILSTPSTVTQRLVDGNIITFKLRPELVYSTNNYIYNKDINGQFFIGTTYNKDIDKFEYVNVEFELIPKEKYENANLFILGGLTNWEVGNDNKFIYDVSTHTYKKTLLLKEGYYDYQFVYSSNNFPDLNKFVQGSYFDTENDYYILVYQKNVYPEYHKIIAYKKINSVSKSN